MYHGGLQSRELCQAPIMQALSSHSRLCESNNFRPGKQLFPKLPEPGLELRTFRQED